MFKIPYSNQYSWISVHLFSFFEPWLPKKIFEYFVRHYLNSWACKSVFENKLFQLAWLLYLFHKKLTSSLPWISLFCYIFCCCLPVWVVRLHQRPHAVSGLKVSVEGHKLHHGPFLFRRPQLSPLRWKAFCLGQQWCCYLKTYCNSPTVMVFFYRNDVALLP